MLAGIFVPAGIFVLAGFLVPAAIFVVAGFFVPAAFFVIAGIFVPVCLFCCFTSQANNYGHAEMVSPRNHTFPGQA